MKYDENDVEWLAECKRNYDEMSAEIIPIAKSIFGVADVEFEIVEPADFNYKLKFVYRGLDITIQYISACADFFVTVVCSGYNEKFIDNMPLANNIEFEQLFSRLKVIFDMIEY